jgi:hypothetical protein
MKTHTTPAQALAVVLAALALSVAPLEAQTNTWRNPAAGKWETGTNWSLGTPPNAAESVFIIATNVASTIATIDAVTLTNAPASLTVSNLTILGNSQLILNHAGTNVPLHVLKNLNLGAGGELDASGSALRVDGVMGMPGGGLILTDGGALNVPNGTLGIGNDGTTTLGTGTGTVAIANATVNARSLNLGSTAGGIGLLTMSTNAVLNVGSNFTVVSASLVATSSVTITGGSLSATNGLTAIGPSGNGVLTVSGGNHTFRQVKLGSSAPVGTGGFHFVGGRVKVLGVGTGPAAGFTSNWYLWENGDLDLSTTSLTIGDGNDSTVTIPPFALNVLGELNSMYVGHSPGNVGTFLQEASTSVVIITNQMIVGDCSGGAVGNTTLSAGILYVTNDTQTAVLNVSNGTFTLGSDATLVVDNLVMDDPCGLFLKQPGATLIQNNAPTLSPNLDADGDGQSNAAEMAAGTDPFDPASVFKITGVVVVNHDVQISWTTVTGHSYVVQSSTALGGPFIDCSPAVPAPGGGESVATYVIPNGAVGDKSFLRVRLGP